VPTIQPSLQSKSKCLTPECRADGIIAQKGLCMRCYSAAKKLVESGRTTWEQLAGMELARIELDPFTKAFNERSSNANGK
jgi:hypothetical protein